MTHSADETIQMFFDSLKAVHEHPDLGITWLHEHVRTFLSGYPAEQYLYKPDPKLSSLIEEYANWCKVNEQLKTVTKRKSSKTNVDSGKLLEEITLLAFKGLQGYNSVKSYQSYASQLDLVISGSNFEWYLLMEYLHIKRSSRTVVVEAKNWDDKVDDKTFSRLCGILQNIFIDSAELGVFVTREGATGFPPNSDDEDSTRRRSLSDAQATQIIFHARTGKYVVVLTKSDIEKLALPGALPIILEKKIRAIEEWTGRPVEYHDDWHEVDLPTHLAKHMEAN